MNKPKNLIDFRNPDDPRWRVINDGVMGGLSRSGILSTDTGTGVFSGELSLENNGGFASVRTQVDRHDLAVFSGLEIRVWGDGRTYQLRLRTDDRLDGIAYRAYFETAADEWITVQIPFEKFQPVLRGRILDDAPVLDTGSISRVGFLLADSRPGVFSVEIDFVRPFRSLSTEKKHSVTTVDSVDLTRYSGLWYEVAKIPNRFQKKCARGTTAQYRRREDGRLDVVNRCLKSDGDIDQAEGIAKIQDSVTNAKLKVSFFSLLGWRPFWGDYWVIGLDPEYQWAIVGTPDRKYGWVLARKPELGEDAMIKILTILERNGYFWDAFEMSPH